MPSTPATAAPTCCPAARTPPEASCAAPAPLDAKPRLRSQDLFAGGQEVQIEHAGALYRLRITALGKLILTK